MKVYEKMGIYLNAIDGFAKLMNLSCFDIFNAMNKPPICVHENDTCSDCNTCKAELLFAEVTVPTKKVKRYEIYNGEFVKAFKDFTHWFVEKNINCEECPYDCKFFKYSCRQYCFAQWLEEEIEVEE